MRDIILTTEYKINFDRHGDGVLIIEECFWDYSTRENLASTRYIFSDIDDTWLVPMLNNMHVKSVEVVVSEVEVSVRELNLMPVSVCKWERMLCTKKYRIGFLKNM
jgi:hypothetical protein